MVVAHPEGQAHHLFQQEHVLKYWVLLGIGLEVAIHVLDKCLHSRPRAHAADGFPMTRHRGLHKSQCMTIGSLFQYKSVRLKPEAVEGASCAMALCRVAPVRDALIA